MVDDEHEGVGALFVTPCFEAGRHVLPNRNMLDALDGVLFAHVQDPTSTDTVD